MASDIVLVLRSEHRDLSSLADQCSRMSRGFEDPAHRLVDRLRAHGTGLERNLLGHPLTKARADPVLGDILTAVREGQARDRHASAELAHEVIAREADELLPVLESALPLAERRRVGKAFRLVRDAALRGSHPVPRRVRSQSELYEVARRAGVEHRSRMTQAELQHAVETWERDRATRR